jgi:hypothetical protein
VRCDGLWTCQDLLVLASRPAVVCLREKERRGRARELVCVALCSLRMYTQTCHDCLLSRPAERVC